MSYILTFTGLSNPIYKGQNPTFFDNKISYTVETIEEIKSAVEKHYSIARPDEFESAINHAFKLLNNKDWVRMCGNNYSYKLVCNSGNPIMHLKLKN